MKGDFSRYTFDHKKHYTQVLMQQGRVQVDTDWNEQQEINRYRVETEAKDVIGQSGTPMEDDGFKITLVPKSIFQGPPHLTDLTHILLKDQTLRIGKGHYYVDGILCENEKDVSYDKQSSLPLQPYLLNPVGLSEALGKAPWGIVYLDVWHRHITALDDAHIREVALGGPDTATRSQTVWQVKILPIGLPTPGIQVTLPPGILDLPAGPSVLKQPDFEKVLAYHNELSASYAKAVKRHSKLADIHIQMEKTSEVLTQIFRQVTCHSDLKEWNDLIAPSTGMLAASTIPPKDTEGPCIIPSNAGYLRLENQLYRVEIHHGNDSKDRPPTFKWSRENGTVVTAITDIKGENIYVNDVGRDDNLGFAAGQWVEIIDDEMELKGLPGVLVLIKEVKEAECLIIPEENQSLTYGFDQTLNPKLRRWDQVETFATNDGVPVTFDTPQELEGGIQVQFSQGQYRTGDYWLIPARTGNDIEWPHDTPNDPLTPSKPIPQPPLGIKHHYCRLALLRQIKPLQFEIQDCRQRFPSLISLAPLTQPALHVTGISWPNDDYVALEKVLTEGLQITLDGEPVPLSANSTTFDNTPTCSPTVIVTMEIAGANMLGWTLLVNGLTRVEKKVIHWTFGQQANISAPPIAPQLLDILHRILPLEPTTIISESHAVQPAPTVAPPLIRVRVTLKGHTIWSEQDGKLFYLDGQAFGRPYTRADGKTACIALQLPSGSGSTASDFESWFYVEQTPAPAVPLRISTINFISALPDQPEQPSSSTIDLSNVPPTSTTPPPLPHVELQYDEFGHNALNVIEITFNRAVSPDGIQPNGKPQSIMVTREAAGSTAGLSRIFGDIQFKQNTNNTVVRFFARDPTFFGADHPQTPYILTVFGSDNANIGPAIQSQVDGAILDGDFDGDPGGDFVLPFEVTLIPG